MTCMEKKKHGTACASPAYLHCSPIGLIPLWLKSPLLHFESLVVEFWASWGFSIDNVQRYIQSQRKELKIVSDEQYMVT